MIKDIFKKHQTALEFFILLNLIFIFIAIRSIHFSRFYNFSTDQAEFSLKALELWRNKNLTLVGPAISWRYQAHYLFQGSITYYVIMFFMILGKWDPLVSGYMFVLFASFFILPFYYGVKYLVNKRLAYIAVLFYALFPFFIDYTRFFWNPNFQFVGTSVVILFMGLYKKYQKLHFLLLVSFTSGMLLLFHYQFIVVIAGLILYYLSQSDLRKNRRKALIFLCGFPLGFSPMIIFEVKNHFYLTNTLLLFLKFKEEVFLSKINANTIVPYYFLSIFPFLFLLVTRVIKDKINNMHVAGMGLVLLFVALLTYVPYPAQAFGMAKDWNYVQEEKVYELIRKENLKDYNVVNLGYDTLATVQKYFHIRDKVKGNWEDYYHNKYLFVITYPQDYMKNPAYEVNTFTPSKVIKKWIINKEYNMYLLAR